MDKQPSILKIISADYAAFLATVFPIVMWGMYGVMLFLGNLDTSDRIFPALTAGITVVSALVLVWRIRLFYRIFGEGVEAPATISKVFFYRDRGSLGYSYTYQGQNYNSGNAVHRVKQTRNLKPGDQVIVIVDPTHPKRAYIRDLYLKDTLD